MAVFGRSLGVARAASIALSSLASALPYLALRSVGVARARALVGLAFVFLSPWSLWLGAATVPESFAASATTAAVIALAHRPRPPFAIALGLACLSRYEPWPAAAALAIALLASRRADPPMRTRIVVAILVCAAPLAWMAWNLHAHGSPLHFFHRVSTFRRASGAATPEMATALLSYPLLFMRTRPEVVFACGLGLVALRDASTRARWSIPLLCMLAQVAFLVVGDARDGAPTHHPERALLGASMLASLFATDALMTTLRSKRGAIAAAFVGGLWLWSTSRTICEPPGATPAEDRSAQVARGAELRRRGVETFTVTPCAYEHFALLAAYGAPENARVLARTGERVGPSCPRVGEE